MTLAREGAKVVVSDFGTNAEGQSSAAVVAEEIKKALRLKDAFETMLDQMQ